MTPHVTVDTLYSIAGYVLISAAGETARHAGVGRMQVHAPLLNLRDLPSIIPNRPTHAEHCLCTRNSPNSEVDSPDPTATRTRVVGVRVSAPLRRGAAPYGDGALRSQMISHLISLPI